MINLIIIGAGSAGEMTAREIIHHKEFQKSTIWQDFWTTTG